MKFEDIKKGMLLSHCGELFRVGEHFNEIPNIMNEHWELKCVDLVTTVVLNRTNIIKAHIFVFDIDAMVADQ